MIAIAIIRRTIRDFDAVHGPGAAQGDFIAGLAIMICAVALAVGIATLGEGL